MNSRPSHRRRKSRFPRELNANRQPAAGGVRDTTRPKEDAASGERPGLVDSERTSVPAGLRVRAGVLWPVVARLAGSESGLMNAVYVYVSFGASRAGVLGRRVRSGGELPAQSFRIVHAPIGTGCPNVGKILRLFIPPTRPTAVLLGVPSSKQEVAYNLSP